MNRHLVNALPALALGTPSSLAFANDIEGTITQVDVDGRTLTVQGITFHNTAGLTMTAGSIASRTCASTRRLRWILSIVRVGTLPLRSSSRTDPPVSCLGGAIKLAAHHKKSVNAMLDQLVGRRIFHWNA